MTISTRDINVVWSDADGEYVATHPTFPSLSWLAATAADARQGFAQLLIVTGLDEDY